MTRTVIQVSRDLTEIIAMNTALPDQAINDARANVDGTSLPGGKAMIAMAPVANLATWERKTEALEREHLDAGKDRPDLEHEDDSWEGPLQVLRFWTDHYRKARNADWDHQPTVHTEARFLQHELGWIAAHEPNWDRLADDINDARVRLENVLHAGRRPERTRVVCVACEKHPQLIKTYAPRVLVGYSCTACGTDVGMTEHDHCPNPWCATTAPPTPTTWVSNPDADGWKCPSCKKRYDPDQLRDAHAKQLRHEKAARFVVKAEAVLTLVAQGRSERLVRRWISPLAPRAKCTVCDATWPHQEYATCPAPTAAGDECGGELGIEWTGDREAIVESYCDTKTRQVWVWWPDLWRRHLATPTRLRRTA